MKIKNLTEHATSLAKTPSAFNSSTNLVTSSFGPDIVAE